MDALEQSNERRDPTETNQRRAGSDGKWSYERRRSGRAGGGKSEKHSTGQLQEGVPTQMKSPASPLRRAIRPRLEEEKRASTRRSLRARRRVADAVKRGLKAVAHL